MHYFVPCMSLEIVLYLLFWHAYLNKTYLISTEKRRCYSSIVRDLTFIIVVTLNTKLVKLVYWSRTNYRHFFLVFVGLFLCTCSPIHNTSNIAPHNFECYQSTYLGWKYKYFLCAWSYQGPFVKLLNWEGWVPIIAILLNVGKYI